MMNKIKNILGKSLVWNSIYLFLSIVSLFIGFKYLIFITILISIQAIIMALLGVEPDGDGRFPTYVLFGFFTIISLIYFIITDLEIYKDIKHKILVKLGKRVPDNWDDYDNKKD